MREGARGAWPLTGACLALAALSLVLPWAIAFDPWAWLSWGRDVTRLDLDTAGGPSWKPLPVVATTLFALAGSAAPLLWLVVARAGGLLALAGAAVLARRLAGPVAAVVAAAAMAITDWWLFNSALGNSEPLFAAATLWAILAHLAGRHRAALWLAVAAGLLRPEAWPFIGLYGLWLWRTRRTGLPELLLGAAVIAGLWFGPDLLGTGGALGASDAAMGPGSAQSASNAAVPGLQVLADFAELVTPPVLAAALAGALLGGPVARGLGLGALAWVLLVAVMTQAGFSGNPRYTVPAAALACVLAGVGVAALARRAPAPAAGPALGAVVLLAALAFTAGDLADQLDELGRRADRRTQLTALVDRAGGPDRITACAPVRTIQEMKSQLGWRLDVPLAHLTDAPRPPAVVFQVSPGYFGEPPGPPVPAGLEEVGRDGAWRLFAACRDGARLG